MVIPGNVIMTPATGVLLFTEMCIRDRSSTLTWEKVTTLDLGLDARFFNDALGVTFD